MTTLTLNKTETALAQFYAELLQEPALQQRLQAATDPESLAKLVVELGCKKGYSFATEEVLAAMAIEAAMGGELWEEKLAGSEVVCLCSCCCSTCAMPEV